MFGPGAIQRTKVQREEDAKNVKQANLAGERFDYLYEHWVSCDAERCKECKEWERVCELLLRVWDS